MKNKLLMSIVFSTAIFAFTLPEQYTGKTHIVEKNAHLCKMFNDKAIAYEVTMRDDNYAKKTLESYQKRVKLYCLK